MCRNYLSNYIGYTVDGTICLKTVTWSTPHLYHLFLVKSNCVISKENSGIISPLSPTVTRKNQAGFTILEVAIANKKITPSTECPVTSFKKNNN